MEAMAVMAVMALALTDTARGPLMPMPTTAMGVMPVTAVATDTAMARGPLTLTTDMAVMPVTAVATDTAMASNSSNKSAIISSHQIVIPCISENSSCIGGQENDGCVSFKQIMSLCIFTLPSY